MSAAASPKPIHVLQLYPRDMNIYGDYGNALVLKQRIRWFGYQPVMHTYDPGDEFPEQVDLLIGGGGQDSGQDRIHQDLLQIGPQLHALANDGTPMLAVCGLYQLFGHWFDPREGSRLDGLGLLDVTTVGTDTRLIGNVVTRSEQFGEIIGYENHSGQTHLGSEAEPFGEVITGEGNNERDSHEGARHQNIIGSYLHGALLPKNPAIADFLIGTAAQRRYDEQLGEVQAPLTAPLSLDQLTERARTTAAARPR
ncbi:MAG: type 1 glutamine amidotransferase [Nesterenkonia sp.]